MRTILLICALLLLTSCQKPGGLQTGDDSPIIISGGSTNIRNPKFTQKDPQEAEITTTAHTAKVLAYRCDPTATDCKAVSVCPQTSSASSPITTTCRVDNLDTHNNWDLALCDLTTPGCSPNGDVRVQWISGGNHLKVHIHKVAPGHTDDFQYPPASQDLLVHPGTPALHDAILTLHGGANPTYYFSGCPTGPQTCLAILY